MSSAEMCNLLASRAYREDRAAECERVTGEDYAPDGVPERAAWLKAQMAMQDLTRHRVAVLGDLDKGDGRPNPSW